MNESLLEKLRRIRLVLTDCDGVLTDNGVYYSETGEVMKRFLIRDGMGVQRLREAGIETGIVTGETTGSVRKRAEKLKISELHQGVLDKEALVRQLSVRREIPLDAIAYIGDDVNDLGVMGIVGLTGCPADAMASVKEKVDIVCVAPGGHGAFREFAETILAAQASVAPESSGAQRSE